MSRTKEKNAGKSIQSMENQEGLISLIKSKK